MTLGQQAESGQMRESHLTCPRKILGSQQYHCTIALSFANPITGIRSKNVWVPQSWAPVAKEITPAGISGCFTEKQRERERVMTAILPNN